MKKMILSALIVICSVFGVASLSTNVSAQAADGVKEGITTATTTDMQIKALRVKVD